MAMWKTKQSHVLPLFFLLSISGWLWEVLFSALTTGSFVNRGFLHGPWLPVYGFGGVAILLLLQRFRGLPLFLLSALLGGSVEYLTSLLLEGLFHTRWWDYASWPYSLNGRICLGSLLAFGLAGWLLTTRLAPALVRLLSHLPSRLQRRLSQALILLFALDAAFSLMLPNTGSGISIPV